MATSDGTLLCIFSGSNCIIVDDFNQQVQQTVAITAIWPGIPEETSSDLNAVCRDDVIGQFIFFKGKNCSVNNFRKKEWAHGSFDQFFDVTASHGDGLQLPPFCGSFEQPDLRLHAYFGGKLEYMNRKPVDLTTPGSQITLGGPTPINQEGDWGQMVGSSFSHISPGYMEAAASHVFWPTSTPGGTGKLTPAILVKDTRPDGNTNGNSNDNTYKCTFIDTQTFTPLKQMWAGWQDDWTIDAATRVEASMIPAVIPDPNPLHRLPHPGPGPALPPNALCDELPNIMKTVCSLTVLMHKALDACYPQSSWPTQPYPDGCTSWGGHKHKRHGCGCQDPQHQTDTPTSH